MGDDINGSIATATRFAESEVRAAERRVAAAREAGDEAAEHRATTDLARWQRQLTLVKAGDEDAAAQVIEECRRSLNASIVSARHSYDARFNGGADGSNSHEDIEAVAHMQALAMENLLRKCEQEQDQG